MARRWCSATDRSIPGVAGGEGKGNRTGEGGGFDGGLFVGVSSEAGTQKQMSVAFRAPAIVRAGWKHDTRKARENEAHAWSVREHAVETSLTRGHRHQKFCFTDQAAIPCIVPPASATSNLT